MRAPSSNVRRGARGDGRAARKRRSGQNTSNPSTKVNLRSTGSKMTCFWRTLHIKHVEPHQVMWYGHLPVSRAGISHRLFEQSKPLRSKNLFDGISALGRAWRTHTCFLIHFSSGVHGIGNTAVWRGAMMGSDRARLMASTGRTRPQTRHTVRPDAFYECHTLRLLKGHAGLFT